LREQFHFGTIKQGHIEVKINSSTAAAVTVVPVLIAISISHFLNDTLQSLIPATYPILKQSLSLSYAQIGLITLINQLVASVLQPVVGMVTDRRHMPYSLPIGMTFTLVGLGLLSIAGTYELVLISVALVGMGSSVFHPESSRVAHMAAGNRRGLAQSVFQVGGNTGSSLGPLLAALIITGRGHSRIAWFMLVALLAIILLWRVGAWYAGRVSSAAGTAKNVAAAAPALPRKLIVRALAVLLILIFSKYFYLASMSNYFTFYLMSRFHLTIANAQVHLFIFLFAVAAGTVIGGPIGDRIGRKYVIWVSILGTAPFSLLLPYAGLSGTTVLSIFVGLILSSAFSAILVYAQEMLPGKIGLISGLFFGLAFGLGGIASAIIGVLADRTTVYFVFQLCAFLPLLGLLAAFLPNLDKHGVATGIH